MTSHGVTTNLVSRFAVLCDASRILSMLDAISVVSEKIYTRLRELGLDNKRRWINTRCKLVTILECKSFLLALYSFMKSGVLVKNCVTISVDNRLFDNFRKNLCNNFMKWLFVVVFICYEFSTCNTKQLNLL